MTAVLGLCPLAAADLISWGDPVPITGTSDVSDTGTLLRAVHLVDNTFGPVTVNRVTFDIFVPTEWELAGTVFMHLSTTGDADFDSLLGDAGRVTSPVGGNPSEWGAFRLETITNLQLGETYEVQLFYTDQRTFTAIHDRTMRFNSAVGAVTTVNGYATNLSSVSEGVALVLVDADPNNSTGAADTVFGQTLTGTFTRTSGAPLGFLQEGSHPNLGLQKIRPHLLAIQIRRVDSLGVNYCAPNVNSTGRVAVMGATGSASVVANGLTLTASDLPTTAFGFFLVGRLQGLVTNPGGRSGNLCLGGSVGRYVGPGQIQNTGKIGTISLLLDLTMIPQPLGFVSATCGDVWSFQTWFRDTTAGGSPTSNFTDGFEVTFQ